MIAAREAVVLFVASSDTHVRGFVPVARAVSARGCLTRFWTLDLLYHQKAGAQLASDRFAYEAIRNPCQRLVQDWRKVPYVLRPICVTRLRSLLGALLIGQNPAVVVLGNDCGLAERTVVHCAGALGIPTLLVQDGLLRPRRPGNGSWTSIALQLPRVVAKGLIGSSGFTSCDYAHGGCTAIAVMGPVVRDRLVAEGIDPQRVVVTGQPRYDQFAQVLSQGPKRARPGSPRRLLYATQPLSLYGECSSVEEMGFHKAVVGALLAVSNAEVVVKLHPRHDQGDLAGWLSAQPIEMVGPDADILSVVMECDLLVCVNSTVAVEAALLDKPVVVLGFAPTQYGEEFSRYGVATVSANAESLASDVLRALDASCDPSQTDARQAFGRLFAYRMDGKAADRVAHLAVQLSRSREVLSRQPTWEVRC